MKTIANIGLLGIAALVIPVHAAQAYVDPGTGSYFMQMLLGLAFGGLMAVKIFYQRIKRFFLGFATRKKTSTHPDQLHDAK